MNLFYQSLNGEWLNSGSKQSFLVNVLTIRKIWAGVKTLNYCLGNQSFFDNTSFVEPSGVPEDLSLLDALLLAQVEDKCESHFSFSPNYYL